VVVYPDDTSEHEIVFQGFEESTINRMELSACIAAMEWVREEGIGNRYSRVQIFSDSQYVVNGQRSVQYWQKGKWRTAAGRPIDNFDLWKQFQSARCDAGVRIDICKVQNKSTPLLRLVDKLAKTAAKSYPRKDRGLITGKVGRAKIKGPATMFPAANQVMVIRVVGSKAVGPDRENRFVFEVYDESTETYVSKHFAYCSPEIGAQLHRQRAFRVAMNDNPEYPPNTAGTGGNTSAEISTQATLMLTRRRSEAVTKVIEARAQVPTETWQSSYRRQPKDGHLRRRKVCPIYTSYTSRSTKARIV
jgi:ribonuclease HI